MNKQFTQCLILIFSLLLSASYTVAASLNWSAVESTQSCVIAGYKVHYGTVSGQYTDSIDVGNTTTYDLDLLSLVPTQTYYFAVSAYSDSNLDGSVSQPVPYRDSPELDGTPVIDYTGNSFDITFNESGMQGAFTKENYSFSPALLFDDNFGITLTGKTYRLRMDDIPAQTIITISFSNITDNKGNALINTTIKLNDDDDDSMADDWEAAYGIDSPFSDADSDGIENQLEFTSGTNPLSTDTDGDGMDDAWEIQRDL